MEKFFEGLVGFTVLALAYAGIIAFVWYFVGILGGAR